MKRVVVSGTFDVLRSRHVRLLEEASKRGPVHVVLWSDKTIRHLTGQLPKFTQAERMYFVQAIRYVGQTTLATGEVDPDAIPMVDVIRPDAWVVLEEDDNSRKRAFCASHRVAYHVLQDAALTSFPAAPTRINDEARSRKKAVVTGCFDWLHSGHVRFFEETAALGDLYVVVGHDGNIRLLKGEGHPLFPENERRYMVQAIRYVRQALVSSGHGWMDAAPEIDRIKPDIYAVNEDGDEPEKRAFCEKHGIEYVVLERLPKEGLPRRESTTLRGF